MIARLIALKCLAPWCKLWIRDVEALQWPADRDEKVWRMAKHAVRVLHQRLADVAPIDDLWQFVRFVLTSEKYGGGCSANRWVVMFDRKAMGRVFGFTIDVCGKLPCHLKSILPSSLSAIILKNETERTMVWHCPGKAIYDLLWLYWWFYHCQRKVVATKQRSSWENWLRIKSRFSFFPPSLEEEASKGFLKRFDCPNGSSFRIKFGMLVLFEELSMSFAMPSICNFLSRLSNVPAKSNSFFEYQGHIFCSKTTSGRCLFV